MGEDCRVHYEEGWRSEDAMHQRVLSNGFTKVLEVLEASPTIPTVEFDFIAKRMGFEVHRDGPRRRLSAPREMRRTAAAVVPGLSSFGRSIVVAEGQTDPPLVAGCPRNAGFAPGWAGIPCPGGVDISSELPRN